MTMPLWMIVLLGVLVVGLLLGALLSLLIR